MLSLAPHVRSVGGAGLLCRLYSSALNGNRSPMDIVANKSNPMLHVEDSNSTSTEAAFELRVPGVVGQGAEPNIARPGTVDWPNPSKQLLEKVPIGKVTHDGDVIQNAQVGPPHDHMPRN